VYNSSVLLLASSTGIAAILSILSF
jgi:hypothetical protein